MWALPALVLGVLVVGELFRRALLRRSALPLPPGPKPSLLWGNILDIPRLEPWKGFRELSGKFGPLVYLHLPLQPTIIVNSVDIAFELLEKRSQNYSDRKQTVMDELMAWDFSFGHMSYGQKWREHRRIFHQYFNQNAVKDYQSMERSEVRLMLGRILETPQHTAEHIRLTFSSVVHRIVYGRQLKSLDDKFLEVTHKSMEGLILQRVPGRFWVEFFPMLRHLPSWVPGATFKKLAEYYKPYVKQMVNVPFDDVVKSLAEGTAPPSVAHTVIQQLPDQPKLGEHVGKEERRARDVLGIAFGAGADTTTASCQAVLTAMVLFPEVLSKAQAELDAVVGPDRLPEFSDYDNLVYVRAVAMEVLRWMPVAPFGLPHRSSADDEYMGYRIPKGTLFMANLWSILRNPGEYPDPERFYPERFIKDGKIDPAVRDPTTVAFGFGRRICPGRHLAEGSLFIFVASILHTFDVTAGVDVDGKPRLITNAASTGLVSAPKCVPSGLKPRSAAAERLIQLAISEQNE